MLQRAAYPLLYMTEIRYDFGPGVIAYSALSAPEGAVLPRQTHTCHVETVESGREDYPDTDALICTDAGTVIGVRTADCVPILLHAPDIGTVAAVHAGWKGTLGGIVGLTIEKLVAMGAEQKLMKAAIGPCICPGCYEVDPEMGARFEEAGFGKCVDRSFGPRPHLDLARVNIMRMLEKGIPAAQISDAPECTKCSGSWPSWRRNPGETRRLFTLISLRRPDNK